MGEGRRPPEPQKPMNALAVGGCMLVSLHIAQAGLELIFSHLGQELGHGNVIPIVSFQCFQSGDKKFVVQGPFTLQVSER